MVADAPESADAPMWETLHSKMKIVGRAVDGLEEGKASGIQDTKSVLNIALCIEVLLCRDFTQENSVS